MKKSQKDETFSYAYFIIPLFFGLIFIALDSIIFFLQNSVSSSFLSYLGPNQDKILRGIAGICMFVLFGSHVRFTMRKQKKIELAREAAEMANKTKSEFLANMSHEIRTPLNGVVGMLNLLEGTQLNPEQKDYVDTAFISAESLLGVINDILDFSKIEAGKLELETRSFNLENEINRSVMIFSSKANEKNLELIVRYDPQAPRFVMGDSIRLRQILNNLISNSLKFTEKGYICVNNDCVGSNDKEAIFEISVEDTGLGITKEQQAVIFDDFTQADTTTTRKFGGSGLGLSICKQLVKLMGGKIELNSTPGKGTVFKFSLTLPINKNGGLEEVDYSALLKEHIIVVDDNSINCKIFDEYLNTWGIRHDVFLSAPNAYEAMENASQGNDPYTLLITDHIMPGMDGEELGKKVKSNAHLKDITMVMISSAGDRSHIEKFEEIGFSGYLTKPLNMSDLFNLLQTVMVQREGLILRGKDAISQFNPDEHEIEEIKNAKDKHILFVEDNKINQKAGISILKRLGFYHIELAENGGSALEMIQKNSYDMVLMDIQMPVMDGYETTKKVREMEIEKNKNRVPIIAQTANAMKGDKEKCLNAGMDDYISKPIDKNELIEILQRWMSTKKTEEKLENYKIETKSYLETRENKETDGSLPVFDYKTALARYSGEHEVLNEIALGFLEECPEDFELIKNALKAQDTSSIAKAAHSVKGSASYVSAERVKQLAHTIEITASSGDLSEIEALFDSLLEEFLSFKKTIETFQWDDIKE